MFGFGLIVVIYWCLLLLDVVNTTDLKIAVDLRSSVKVSFDGKKTLDVGFRLNTDLKQVSRELCRRYVGRGPAFKRCYHPLVRTLLRNRIQRVNEQLSNWVSIPENNAKTGIYDGLLYTLSSMSAWAHDMLLEAEPSQSPKQICIVGGNFCPHVLYTLALSIPSEIELINVLTATPRTHDFCGSSSGSVYQDLYYAEAALSVNFNNYLLAISNVEADSILHEVDVEIMLEETLLRLLRGNSEKLRCDLLIVREGGPEYVHLLLSLIHRHRSLQTHRNPGAVAVIREHGIHHTEYLVKVRDCKSDCLQGRMLASKYVRNSSMADDDSSIRAKTKSLLTTLPASTSGCSCSSRANWFNREYLVDGTYSENFVFESCEREDYFISRASMHWMAYTIVPEYTTLTDWTDFQGYSSAAWDSMQFQDMLEIHIGISIIANGTLYRSPYWIERPLPPLRQGGDKDILERDRWMIDLFGGTCNEYIAGSNVPTTDLPIKREQTGFFRSILQKSALFDLEGFNRPTELSINSPNFHDKVSKTIVFLITYSSRLFEDNAWRLREKFRQLSGFIPNNDGLFYEIEAHVVGYSPLPFLKKYYKQYFDSYSSLNLFTDSNAEDQTLFGRPMLLQFHFGCHNIGIFLRNYICYQSEQPFSFIFRKEFQAYYWSNRIMANALSIAVMSDYHKDAMLNNSYRNVYLIPFYTKPFPVIHWKPPSVAQLTLLHVQVSRSLTMMASLSEAQSVGKDDTMNSQDIPSLNSLLDINKCSRWHDSRSIDNIIEQLSNPKKQCISAQYEYYLNFSKSAFTKKSPDSGVEFEENYPEESSPNFESSAQDIMNLPINALLSKDRFLYPTSLSIEGIRRELRVDSGLQRSWNLIRYGEVPFDMLLYGICSLRRLEMRTLATEFYHQTRGLWPYFICVQGWRESLFDAELQRHIIASKTVVNMHSHDKSSLQIHRLLYLYTLGKCVVSERSTLDSKLDDAVRTGTLFSESIAHMFDIVDVIAHDRYKQFHCERQSLKLGRQLDANIGQLAAMIRDVVDQIRERSI